MSARKGSRTGQCRLCACPDRARAELLLAGGASFAAVGRKFKLHHDAVRRHWAHHVSASRKGALALGPVQREALAARVAEESEAVIDHHRAVRAGLYELYNAALEAGDRTGGSMIAGRLIEVNGAIARITGQLATSPLIQNNTVNFYGSPEFAQFQADLVRVLCRFPDAREAVLAEFERLETAATDTPPADRAALEHQPSAVA